MNNAIGLAVTIRVRLGVGDAYSPRGEVSPARLLSLFHDAATELIIRLDGDEGVFREWERVEVLAPAFVGDFIEASAVIAKVGSTIRVIEFEARKVAGYLREEGQADSAAVALASPVVIARATGDWVVPRALQRHPRLVLPALPPARRRRGAKLPRGSIVITPTSSVIVTSAPTTPIDIMVSASILGPSPAPVDGAALPQSPEQAAEEARRCVDAGASIIDMAFEPVGQESCEQFVERASEYVQAVKAHTDALVSVSLATGGLDLVACEMLGTVGADLMGLALGSFNYGDRVVSAPRESIRSLAALVSGSDSKLVWEAFDLGHISELYALSKEKVFRGAAVVSLTFGVPGAMSGRDEEVEFVSGRLPKNAVWFAAGIGRYQRRVSETAIDLGGHVRVGVANNPLLRRGVLADSSAVFVEKTLSFASRMGRNPASPQRARQLLGLSMDDHGQQETAAGVTIDSNGEETE